MSKREIGLSALFGGFFLFASSVLLAQAPPAVKFDEGVHYTAIKNAAVASGDTVEVIEAFSYLCPHCGAFEPYISSWEQRKPKNVRFRRIPVVFGRDSWEVYARAYVTAEMMGITDAAHGALMNKLWKAKEVPRSMEELSQFYAGFGADPETFLATSKSFAVDARFRKDQRDVQNFGVQGTPSIVVDGKYLVSGNEAIANYDVMLDVVDFLVSMELAARNTAAAVTKDEVQKVANSH